MLKLKLLWNKLCIIVIEICIKLLKLISIIMDKCHDTLQTYRDMVSAIDEEINDKSTKFVDDKQNNVNPNNV